MTHRTIAIDIGEDIDRPLGRLAQETGHDKRDIVRAALIEWLEDVEDTRDGIAIRERDEPSRSIDDVRSWLGLESVNGVEGIPQCRTDFRFSGMAIWKSDS